MSNQNPNLSDPLLESFQDRDRTYLDRVFYATGILLDASDFQAEQTYHRGRLARTLAYLHGSGTVAGLRVIWNPFEAADQAEQYGLTLLSLETEEAIPEDGNSVVILARIGESYHVRIFNRSGTQVLDLGPEEFAPDAELVEALDAALIQDSIEEQAQRELIQMVISSVGRTPSEELKLAPGLAVDYLGRLIEIPPQGVCMRLGIWYEQQSDDDLAFHTAVQSGDIEAPTDGVVVDLYLRFLPCERGNTPAFAAGPFDATDAVQPSRLRDGYEVFPVIRRNSEQEAEQEPTSDDPLPLPKSPWPLLNTIADETERRSTLQSAILDRWQEQQSPTDQQERLRRLGAHPSDIDPTAILLARVVIPATQSGSERPVRQEDTRVVIDNISRPFVYPPSAIARWLGMDDHPADVLET